MQIESLRKWFLAKKRNLPWRDSPSPYQVWVSEVMLQQTQVEVVIEYYHRWMEKFPSIQKLAEASLEEVIKAWEGLGYYSRARRLHEGAIQICKEFGGKLPSNEEDLMKIKGIGPYTVGAILSFAFHHKKAAVDGNVLRVMARHKLIEEDIGKQVVIRNISKIVQESLPEENPWEITEALIELGALVCKKKPLCGQCPIRTSCKAYEKNKIDVLPIKKKTESSISLYRAVVILISEDKRVLCVKESDKSKIMADLWEFPYLEEPQLIESPQVPAFLSQLFTEEPVFLEELKLITHSFTKYRAYLFPSMWKVSETPTPPGYKWIHLSELSLFPFSSGHRAIKDEIESRF